MQQEIQLIVLLEQQLNEFSKNKCILENDQKYILRIQLLQWQLEIVRVLFLKFLHLLNSLE